MSTVIWVRALARLPAGPALNGPADNALDWPAGGPGRASSQFVGAVTEGLAEIEQEQSDTWLAGLVPTGICNYMQAYCT